MAIRFLTFEDYTPFAMDNGEKVKNPYYPKYTYFAHDIDGSLVDPSSIIIHSMCVPAQESPSGQLSTDPYDAKNLLERLGISTHIIIPENCVDDTGETVVYQMTQYTRQAWHAGKSRLPSLKNGEEPVGLNPTSIGIELLNDHEHPFTNDQYIAVAMVVARLIVQRYPMENILGHNEVAGDDVRGVGKGKTDPEGFDWNRFMGMLATSLGVDVAHIMHYRSRVI